MEDLTPLYNKEFYLAYLCGEDVVLPIPDGNAERYLAYLCGMDVTIPDVPDGRTETYLAYKCGEDVVLPDPMYRIEFYLAKWCGVDCEVPEPMYRIEYWLAQLANSGELKAVTGNPISVSDALARPAESLVIEILPQQSGSGDPSPDNVRPITGFTGVNIYRESAYDPDADPTYSISWQDSAGTVYGGSLDVTSGVMTVDRAMVIFDGSDDETWYISTPWGKTNTAVFYSTEISGAYYPDWTDYCGMVTNLFLNATRYYIYSNDVECCGFSGTVATAPSPTVRINKSRANTVDAFRTFLGSNNLQFCYELATPLTIQLTPTQVQLLLGNNVLWNDINGDMTLEYLADGPADDVDALQILLGNRYVNNGAEDEATDREALEILLGGNTR